MRYRNPHPWPMALPEHQADDGRTHPTVQVEPGHVLDWPIPIAGFETATPERPAKKNTGAQGADNTEAGA